MHLKNGRRRAECRARLFYIDLSDISTGYMHQFSSSTLTSITHGYLSLHLSTKAIIFNPVPLDNVALSRETGDVEVPGAPDAPRARRSIYLSHNLPPGSSPEAFQDPLLLMHLIWVGPSTHMLHQWSIYDLNLTSVSRGGSCRATPDYPAQRVESLPEADLSLWKPQVAAIVQHDMWQDHYP